MPTGSQEKLQVRFCSCKPRWRPTFLHTVQTRLAIHRNPLYKSSKSPVYQGFSALQVEEVRSQGRPSCSPVQQALIYTQYFRERHPLDGVLFLRWLNRHGGRPLSSPALIFCRPLSLPLRGEVGFGSAKSRRGRSRVPSLPLSHGCAVPAPLARGA